MENNENPLKGMIYESESTDLIDAALAAAIAEIPAIGKNGKANFGKHATLDDIYETIREPLRKYGITVEHYIVGDGYLMQRVAHKGQYIRTIVKFPEESNSRGNKIQAMGSATTYLKRYCLGATFRVVTDEDTDGDIRAQPAEKEAAPKEFTPNEAWKDEAPSAKALGFLNTLSYMPKNLELNIEMLKLFDGDIANMSKWDVNEWITKMKGS